MVVVDTAGGAGADLMAAATSLLISGVESPGAASAIPSLEDVEDSPAAAAAAAAPVEPCISRCAR